MKGASQTDLLCGRGHRVCAKKIGLLAGLVMIAAVTACQTPSTPLAVVEDVDLDRYVGRWFEIASFPQRFQEGCVATTATYTRLAGGRIGVENECRDESLDGELRRVEGVAWLTDPSNSSAKLQVQFFWPFHGDYWIIELDPTYQYAVVGHPSRDYLWILSRTPTMDPVIYETLLERLQAKSFEIDRLIRTTQPDPS